MPPSIRCTLRVIGTKWQSRVSTAMKLTTLPRTVLCPRYSRKPPTETTLLPPGSAVVPKENALHLIPVNDQSAFRGMRATADFLESAHMHMSVCSATVLTQPHPVGITPLNQDHKMQDKRAQRTVARSDPEDVDRTTQETVEQLDWVLA